MTAGPGVPPFGPDAGGACTGHQAAASGTWGVLGQPADGFAGEGLRGPGRHSRSVCRPAPVAGPVPALAGLPEFFPAMQDIYRAASQRAIELHMGPAEPPDEPSPEGE